VGRCGHPHIRRNRECVGHPAVRSRGFLFCFWLDCILTCLPLRHYRVRYVPPTPPPPPYGLSNHGVMDCSRQRFESKGLIVKVFRNKDLSSILGLNSRFGAVWGRVPTSPPLGSLSPAEHLGLSKSTGCRGLAGQGVIVASGRWGVCDGAHRMIVMKEFQWLPGWAPMLPTRFEFGRCPADNRNFSVWQQQRKPLLKRHEKWRPRREKWRTRLS
jgi:hypothetical protein